MKYFVITYYSNVRRKWIIHSYISGQWKVKTNIDDARQLKRELQRNNPRRKVCIRPLLENGNVNWRYCG